MMDAEFRYDAWALTYDQTLREWGYEAPEKIAELLADHRSGSSIPLRAPVLDCGCGTGLSSEALSANGFESMYGVDVSDESLALCKTKGLHEVLELCELDTEPLPFSTDIFGAVVCVGVLSYVKEFEHIFGEWCRATRPGGLCAFTTRTWDEDTNGIRTAAERLVSRGKWRQRYMSDPSPYMPNNPLPDESSKRIRYLIYEVLNEQS
jgi:predicted TPR repeat methyltransferase